VSLNILLANDDGFEAEGITVLFEALLEAGHDVGLVAPDTAQSAQGSTLGGVEGLTEPFGITPFVPEFSDDFTGDPDEVEAFAVGSTTVGTVLTGIALAENGLILGGEEIDVVITGTNEGENIGESPNISGTVNGALAGLFEGLPAIAVSAGDNENPELAFERAAGFTVELLATLEAQQPAGAPLLPAGTGLSVNVPESLEFDGVAATIIDEEVSAMFPIVPAEEETDLDDLPEEVGGGAPPEFVDVEGDEIFLSSDFIPVTESSGNAISEGAQFLLDRITVSAIDGNWFSSESDRATLEARLAGVLDDEQDSTEGLDIVLVNDDGFDAPGITAARDALLEAGHNVTIVAPLVDQSFQGSALTIFGPWTAQEFEPGNFAVQATPNTTLTSGFDVLLNETPDLVVAGIDDGAATGLTANTSATLAAAVTAIFENDIPAIAISAGVDDTGSTPAETFAFAADVLAELIDGLLETAPTEGDFILADERGLNVNVPVDGTLENLAFTRIDEATDQDIDVELIPIPGNDDTFRFAYDGPIVNDDPDSEGSNFVDGNITISPLDGNYTADLATIEAIAALLGLEFGDPTLFAEEPDAIGSDLPGATVPDAGISADDVMLG